VIQALINRSDLIVLVADYTYHYCSLDTFIKIITSKSLYLSEILKTNDLWNRSGYLQYLK
jgi:hypothetical protein